MVEGDRRRDDGDNRHGERDDDPNRDVEAMSVAPAPGGARGSVTGVWPSSLDKGFVGGTTDPTGLTHVGAREYDPATGRFVSTDPVVDTKRPQALHAYAYANNNPTANTDPSGKRFAPPGGGSGWMPTCPQAGTVVCGPAHHAVAHATVNPADDNLHEWMEWWRMAFVASPLGQLVSAYLIPLKMDDKPYQDAWSYELGGFSSGRAQGYAELASQTGVDVASRYGWNPYRACRPTCLELQDERQNAFRHAYWMALMTANGFSTDDALDLGVAHEMDPTSDPHGVWGSQESRVDLQNNRSGALIGIQAAQSYAKRPASQSQMSLNDYVAVQVLNALNNSQPDNPAPLNLTGH